MKLHFIRHAEMAGDPYICPPPPVSDCLSPKGLAQAQALANTLQGEPIDIAFSSPYGRALQTAEIALTDHNIPIIIVPGLEEWIPALAVRQATNTEYKAIQARDRERYAEETWKTEQGEGTFDVYARVIPALLEAFDEFGWHHRMGGWVPESEKTDATVAVFAHGGSLNVMLAFLLGLMPFPVGRFSFAHTGQATLSFTERHGLYYPALEIPAPDSKYTPL